MAYLKIEIPDGPYCNGCAFKKTGKSYCNFFGDLIEVKVKVGGTTLNKSEKHIHCFEGMIDD